MNEKFLNAQKGEREFCVQKKKRFFFFRVLINFFECDLFIITYRYFLSLAVGGKLQRCLSGERCNIDAFELYEEATKQHMLDTEQWPTWIGNQLALPEQPQFTQHGKENNDQEGGGGEWQT